MRLVEILRSALRGLAATKARATLTTLGVLIGVGAVVLLVAVGNGSGQQIQQRIQALGTNTLTVVGGRSIGGSGPQASSGSLTLAVAHQLADRQLLPDVASVTPEVSSSQSVAAGGLSTSVQVIGTEPSYFTATNSPLAGGSAFSAADVAAGRRVAVIGAGVQGDLFAGGDPIGRQIQVGAVPFTVVGVLTSKGAQGLTNADETVVAPLSTVQASLTGYGSISQIVVEATGPDTVAAAGAEVTTMLDQLLDVTNPADAPYDLLDQSQLLQTRAATTTTFTVLLAAIAGISLLVGGIGITNIMLVTVAERTREIGIRKALGAPNWAILAQFLVESTLVSVLGGLLGVLAGVVGSRFTIVGVKPVLLPVSIVLALAVSVAIGVFFGSYPAHRAARMRPVEALRYE